MPFGTEKQRAIMYAAKDDPKLREQLGLTLAEVLKMIEHDTNVDLPAQVSKATMDSITDRKKRERERR